MFHRTLNLPKSNSFFLFGPRGTGKSSLIASRYQPQQVLKIDLLEDATESEFILNPDLLLARVRGASDKIKIIFIDEIQKVPKLLDLVHKLIEETGKQFILTGSSARKLRHGGANLLAGRAFERHLFSLTHEELKETFDLDLTLKWGSLPKVFSFHDHADKQDFLKAYGSTYLKQEIMLEQLVRRLDPFRKFLMLAARADGKVINFKSFATQVGVDYKTVQNYFQVLEDTLIGFFLDAFHTSQRLRASKHPKFYFFDTGVSRALGGLLKVEPVPSTSYYGDVFESWLINEIHRLNSYRQADCIFSYFSDHDSKAHVDLVIERPNKPGMIIEIKSTTSIREEHAAALSAAQPFFKGYKPYVFSNDVNSKKFDKTLALHWKDGINEIFL